MKSCEKELPCQSEGNRGAGHIPDSAHFFSLYPHLGPVIGSGLVKPLVSNPEKSAPEDLLGCHNISGHQNQGHPGLQLNLDKTTWIDNIP